MTMDITVGRTQVLRSRNSTKHELATSLKMYRPTTSRRESINRRSRRQTSPVILPPRVEALRRLRKERPHLPKVKPFLPRLLIKLLPVSFVTILTHPLALHQQTTSQINYGCARKTLQCLPLRATIKRPIPPMHSMGPPFPTTLPLMAAHQSLTALLAEQMTSQVPRRLPLLQFPAIQAPCPDLLKLFLTLHGLPSTRRKRNRGTSRVHSQCCGGPSSPSINSQRHRRIRAKPAVDAEPVLCPRCTSPGRESLHLRLRGRKVLRAS